MINFMSIFDQVTQLPPDPIFGLAAEYKKDLRKDKFSLITGYYRDETLKTPLLETVAEVESQLASDRGNREYLPIDGDQEFIAEIGKLVFGEVSDNICGIQTVGGTGALYLIGRLATQFTDQIAISNPTWANHFGIFSHAGLKTLGYPYYANKKITFAEMVEKLTALPKGASVLIHTNSHNPTSLDLTKEQWQELQVLIQKKGLFPILDMAYQGFASTPDDDAYGPRLFLNAGLEFALTYTCAKNFSIYGERAGALFVIANSRAKIIAIQSQLKSEARSSYSNPPVHASNIVKTILKDPMLKKRWLKELEAMRARMNKIRNQFIDKLAQRDPSSHWEHLRRGTGLFFYSEKTPDQVAALRKEGFYLAADGRINLTGLNDQNIESFTTAFLDL